MFCPKSCASSDLLVIPEFLHTCSQASFMETPWEATFVQVVGAGSVPGPRGAHGSVCKAASNSNYTVTDFHVQLT